MLSAAHGTCSALHLSPRAGRGRIASAIRVRGSICKRGGNRLKHFSHVPQNVVIPETQDAVVVVGKPFVASRIPRIVGMLAAVDFDNQTRLATYEIDSVESDRLLPNELISAEPARSQPVPKYAFGIGRIPPEPSRAFSLDLFGTAQASIPPHPPRFARRPLPARGERRTYHKSA
jgi:hypothetical protein